MVKISAGSYDLNRWLYGGYETDVVSVIYGPSGSGKTNFCLLAAVSQAKKGNKVVYMDTEGGFSVERIKQLAPEDYDTVLGNIMILKPTNFSEQKRDFEKLLDCIKDHVSLIIVDGLTMLYRLDFADARNKDINEIQKVNSELAKQMRSLAEIARKQEIPVIVTSQVYHWENEERIVGGDILKYWAKCHIELTNNGGKRTANLRKHRSLPEKPLDFEIVNSGIRKKGWL